MRSILSLKKRRITFCCCGLIGKFGVKLRTGGAEIDATPVGTVMPMLGGT